MNKTCIFSIIFIFKIFFFNLYASEIIENNDAPKKINKGLELAKFTTKASFSVANICALFWFHELLKQGPEFKWEHDFPILLIPTALLYSCYDSARSSISSFNNLIGKKNQKSNDIPSCQKPIKLSLIKGLVSGTFSLANLVMSYTWAKTIWSEFKNTQLSKLTETEWKHLIMVITTELALLFTAYKSGKTSVVSHAEAIIAIFNKVAK